MMILRNILTMASALALAACAVGPDYKAPQSASAPAATGPFVSADSPAVSLDPVAADWWRLYDAPVLDGLVADGIGREACREGVWPDLYISVVAESLKKKKMT